MLVDILANPRITLRDRGNSDTILGVTGAAGQDNFFISTYGKTNALVIKGSDGNVGINKTAPTNTLDVVGGISASGNIVGTGFCIGASCILDWSATNAHTVDNLHINTGVNNVANSLVRTDASGYIQAGYLNSGSGNEGNNSNPARVWGTNGSDSYLRTYLTSALSVGYAGSAGSATTATNATNATNAGNSDTVDSWHRDDLRAWGNLTGKPNVPINQDGSRYTTDFNTLLATGFYNGEGTPTNAPNSYGQLITARGADTGLQIAGGYSSDNLWFRGWWSSGAGFSAWRSVIHSGNIASQSVNYAGSAGSATSATNATNAGNADTTDGYHLNQTITYGSSPAFDTINTGTAGDPLEINYLRAGDMRMYGGDITMQAGYYLYPGSSSGLTNFQKNYYLSSNASWGLYTNTSFNAAGGLYDAGNRTITTSSIGSQSVSYAGSAGSATSAGYATSAGSITNFSVAHGVNPDTKGTTGIHYFGGGATSPYSDGTLIQQAYQSAPTTWGSQIMQDYRTGRLAVRGLNSTNWTGWLNIIDSGNIGSQSVNYANSADTVTTPSGTYKHLGAWGVGRTASGAILVNTAYYADNAGSASNADTVDSQNFAWSNNDNNPSYLWGANSNGSSFLVARGSMSVNYAGSAGSATNATNAARAQRANGNFYIDDNYGNGVVGVYTSTRYQGVFAMGDSYKLPADGSTTGSLYGLAWSHPNAGGVASNLNSHGLLVMENGTFLAAISGSIRARDDMRAPIFAVNGGSQFMASAQAQNMKLKGGSSTDVGITGYNSSDTWVWQLYGAGANYGFLNGNWAGWDMMKTIGGALTLNGSQTVIHSGNIGSQSVNYASSAGSVTNATNATNATYGRYAYNNGAYSGSGWVEPSDLGVRYANSAGSVSNADMVDGLHDYQFFNNMGQNHSTQADFNTPSNFGFRFIQGSTNGPGISGATQYYNLGLGLGNDYPYTSYAMQFAIPRTPQGGSPYPAVRFRESGTWGSWSRIYAGYADNSDLVDGLQPASLSVNYAGSAGSVTNATNATNADVLDGYHVSTSGSANTIPTRNGSGYIAPASWIQFDGNYGIYSPTNGAHFYPNPGAYGSWSSLGTKGGWGGIEFGAGAGNITLMIGQGGWGSMTTGMHANNYGWLWRFEHDKLIAGSASFSSDVTASAYYYSSDRNLKTNIKTLDNSLDKILQLRGVSFDWKKDGKTNMGLIAQEVKQVYPELVGGENGNLSIQYGNLVAPLIEAVKEQQKKINILETRIKVLENKK